MTIREIVMRDRTEGGRKGGKVSRVNKSRGSSSILDSLSSDSVYISGSAVVAGRW